MTTKGLLDLPNELLAMIMGQCCCPNALFSFSATNCRLRDVFNGDSNRIIPNVLAHCNDPLLQAAFCTITGLAHANNQTVPGTDILRVVFRLRRLACDQARMFALRFQSHTDQDALALIYMFMMLYASIQRRPDSIGCFYDTISRADQQASPSAPLLLDLGLLAARNLEKLRIITDDDWKLVRMEVPIRQYLTWFDIFDGGHLQLLYINSILGNRASLLHGGTGSVDVVRLFFRLWTERTGFRGASQV